MIQIQEHVLLAPYTIYQIGGFARFFIEVAQMQDLQEAMQFAAHHHLDFAILGAGSNVLISDNGFNGLVMRMIGNNIKVKQECMTVDAGVMMARAVLESARNALQGFEWGIGVPGTIGGSIRGNAGCFGGEMHNVVESVEVYDNSVRKIRHFSLQDCQFGYRDSLFKIHPELIIISAVLRLGKGDRDTIQQEILRITKERIAKQDIGTKSCGCIFTNTPWPYDSSARERMCAQFPELAAFRSQSTIPSAFLIEQCGMQGQSKGSVSVSYKHANFFINNGGGRSNDVIALIEATKEAVRKQYGLELKEEMYKIGF